MTVKKLKHDELIEIIPKVDGTLVCQLSWRDQKWQEDLPRGCDKWPKVEFKSHLQSHVIPKLRLQLLKAQKESLESGSMLDTEELSQPDLDRIGKAQEKRLRKAAKLRILN